MARWYKRRFNAKECVALKRIIGVDETSPHMSGGASVVAESFFWLFEVLAYDVYKRLNRHLRSGIEAVIVMQRNQARFHIPGVIPRIGVC